MTNRQTAANISVEAFIVPLNKLALDPKNVRKTYSKEGIEELAATIRADGYRLLQNIVVRKADKKGHFLVTAGGRRLAALQLLCDNGEISKDYGVECKERDADDATGISLIENSLREDMLGSVLQLSCWVRTAVTFVGDIHGAYRGRQSDVRVKRSRSEARTTLDAAAARQAF
uniref:ParB-like partitioning protein n=1 Tax=Ochrobactrum sp. LM19 TaxID=1449781 RepID=A0A0D5A0W5_9HYPH|nr:ParB/Srx family N-terminal domain-containing protein [Ochrobactrum sp. LM19]AJW29955.1 ParB-like partitioning protein [Ochrobactrum sp. LM19]